MGSIFSWAFILGCKGEHESILFCLVLAQIGCSIFLGLLFGRRSMNLFCFIGYFGCKWLVNTRITSCAILSGAFVAKG